MKSYSEFAFTNGLLFDYSDNKFPTKLYSWNSKLNFTSSNSTFYGYVFQGDAHVKTPDNNYKLISKQFFCFNDDFTIEGGSGIIMERIGYHGYNLLGGPIESSGRLKYIDGCTDSLLIPPVKLGDPCLNALYFPPNINQTAHTHPSMRVGMVVEGAGICVTPDREYDLEPGKIFIIHEEGLHKFKTNHNTNLTVIAYHPDSDFGPEDEDHPMINRTIVEGVSASKIKEIQTR